jgi:hypothetical protein
MEAFFDEQVADAPHSMDLCGGRRIGQLPTQMVDVDGNGIGPEFVINAVELYLKHRLRHNPTQASHQVFEDRAFTPRQGHERRAHAHITTERVEVNVTGLEYGSQRRQGGAAGPWCGR